MCKDKECTNIEESEMSEDGKSTYRYTSKSFVVNFPKDKSEALTATHKYAEALGGYFTYKLSMTFKHSGRKLKSVSTSVGLQKSCPTYIVQAISDHLYGALNDVVCGIVDGMSISDSDLLLDVDEVEISGRSDDRVSYVCKNATFTVREV